jgi:hypothetical protein
MPAAAEERVPSLTLSPYSHPAYLNTGTDGIHLPVITHHLSPHHSPIPRLSPIPRCRFGDDQLRALEAALSAGADVPAMLSSPASPVSSCGGGVPPGRGPCQEPLRRRILRPRRRCRGEHLIQTAAMGINHQWRICCIMLCPN